MWALAHAKAGELLTPEVREALGAAVIKSIPFDSQKGMEVLIWSSRRNMLDMQDVYLAATAAVRMPGSVAATGFRVRVRLIFASPQDRGNSRARESWQGKLKAALTTAALAVTE